MTDLIDLNLKPIKDTLKILLQDKTTKKNIIWATDSYKDLGSEYRDKQQITVGSLTGIHSLILQPRISKSLEQQQDRTKQKAEVFTPSWICNKMNNYCDEQYFGKKDVFNIEKDNSWETNENKIIFKNDDDWKDYVSLRKLEITCGESPFIVSRYDASTGVLIVPPSNRIGFLDRKIRLVNENTNNEEEWFDWIVKAYQSTYGYEFQGDSLLIGRINLFMTFVDNIEYKWNRQPTVKETETIANIISRNLFQMDGLTDTVPLGLPQPKVEEMTIFDFLDEKEENKDEIALDCKIYDWKKNVSITFKKIKERKNSMKFDYVIGNPPYQDSSSVNNRAGAIYPYFYDAAELVGKNYILISPARFLFNTGLTSKEWNQKMLYDSHLKVLNYEQESKNIFPNTEIKGGIAIIYKGDKECGAIGDFIPNKILRTISSHFKAYGSNNLSLIMYGGRSDLKFTNTFLNDFPNSVIDRLNAIKEKHSNVTELSPNEEYELKSSSFKVLPYAFYNANPGYKVETYELIGLVNGERYHRWIKREYMTPRYPNNNNIRDFKVLVPESNGSGKFGETLSSPIVVGPYVSCTPTFISVGKLETKGEAENLLKYIKTKLCRSLLGILKKTQHNPSSVWKYVPLQDFTSNSDIDWSKSVHEIDLQLYKKYGLSDEEIEFIESHVKEME